MHRLLRERWQRRGMHRPRHRASPFRYFSSSPEIIRVVAMMYVRFPLSPRNVEGLLAERGIDIWHEAVRHWWGKVGTDVRGRGAPLAGHYAIAILVGHGIMKKERELMFRFLLR